MVAPMAPHAEDPPVVLLVEHDVDTRDLYSLVLARSGFAVEQATCGDEALQKTKTLLPDVVVADITLPGMDGFALCREIKEDEHTAHIPVIAVTGYSSPDGPKEAQKAGFDRFFLKPCLPDDLIVALRLTVQETRAHRTGAPCCNPGSEG